MIFQWFLKVFLVFVVFAINADIGWIRVPTWLHFGAVWAPKTRLGSVLEHLGGVLERLRGMLGRLGCVLGAFQDVLGSSWARLGGVLGRLRRKVSRRSSWKLLRSKKA